MPTIQKPDIPLLRISLAIYTKYLERLYHWIMYMYARSLILYHKSVIPHTYELLLNTQQWQRCCDWHGVSQCILLCILEKKQLGQRSANEIPSSRWLKLCYEKGWLVSLDNCDLTMYQQPYHNDVSMGHNHFNLEADGGIGGYDLRFTTSMSIPLKFIVVTYHTRKQATLSGMFIIIQKPC